MTPRDLIREAAVLFRHAGVPDPEYDSALLLSHLCGRPPLMLRLDTDTALDDGTISRFRALCGRRLKREPLQYILGEASFCGFPFYVDPRVLIPRPETELLCEWALELIPSGRKTDILDLCCGSGCIGISLKLSRPAASVCLSDISADALDVAARNAARLNADVAICRSDLFSDLPVSGFDIIVSNPPYIPSPDCASLQAEVMKEPLSALDGGDDGLCFYRRICSEAPRHLKPGGFLLMELGDSQADRVRSLMDKSGFVSVTVRKDYQSLERMICGMIQERRLYVR